MNAPDQTFPDQFVVALDAHGGDFGPEVTVPAALQVLATQDGLRIILCGIPDQVQSLLDKYAADSEYSQCIERLELCAASHALARVGCMLAGRSLKRALARFEPAKHNGAPLLGLQGVVVKSHGNAGRSAMANAILEAVKESERCVPQRIETMINDYSIEGSQ